MSWTSELYEIYRQHCGRNTADEGEILLPVSHSTANAQIELTINEQGEFVTARTIEKSDAVTVIPVTEDSGARANGISPMPYADKLLYIAGDYGIYAEGKRADTTKYFEAYMNQLARWRESEYTHPAVHALFVYLEQKTLMRDLVGCGVLKTDEATGKLLAKTKIAGIAQEDSFVRIRVEYHSLENMDLISMTWKDRSLYDSFISFNSSIMGNVQLCYALGKELPATYKHPSKVRNAGDKAKLISSNDESGFTYRGRFSGKEEAISVSYEFSQKMHNALKWLIQKQGIPLDSLTLIPWASALQEIPSPLKDAYSLSDMDEDEEDEDAPDEYDAADEAVADTEAQYHLLLQKMIWSYKESLKPETKVMLMGLDAATTGRLSIAIYTELEGSCFLDNLHSWHRDTAALRFDGRQKKNMYNSFSVYEIIRCAFGTEINEKLECKKELLRDNVLRLLPCIMEGRAVPVDIVQNLYYKASNPLAYEKSYNHRTVLETACGLIRKKNLEQKKGVISMGYDPNETSRSYLYGCLLAIADKAESSAYDKEDRDKRITNARRYWNTFSRRPWQTWLVIESRLRPYLDKLDGAARISYEKQLNAVMEKFRVADFENDSPLNPSYLLGYHHYMAHSYKNLKNKNTEEE